MSSLKEKRKRIQFVYKTTNLLNGTYYIGVHSTWNLDDGYIGSGKRLGRAIKKYGKENFKREILQFFETNKEAYEYEAHLVNEERIKDELCLNLKPGGSGGCTPEVQQIRSKAGGKSFKDKFENDENFRNKIQSNLESLRNKLKTDLDYREKFCLSIKNNKRFEGKSHTEDSKQKMRESSKGKGTSDSNSQFGTCWITNGTQNMKIRKGYSIPEGWSLGRKIK
jgi:hypothetical protein